MRSAIRHSGLDRASARLQTEPCDSVSTATHTAHVLPNPDPNGYDDRCCCRTSRHDRHPPQSALGELEQHPGPMHLQMRLQVAAMLPEAYTSMCEGYTAAFSRLLAEPHSNDDPVFLHRAVRPHGPEFIKFLKKQILSL